MVSTRLVVLLAVFFAIVGAKCNPPTPPNPPPSGPVGFDVVPCRVEVVNGQCPDLLTGAVVDVSGTARTCCINGVTSWSVDASIATSPLDVRVSADGYQTRTLSIVPSACTGGCHNVVALLTSGAGEHGWIRRDGLRFIDEDGKTWTMVSASDFRLFELFLKGESLDALLTDRILAGFNTVRVFGMYQVDANGNGIGVLRPQDHSDYYEQLHAFLNMMAGRGIRVEFTAMADAQRVMPDLPSQRTHFDRVVAVLRDHWNAFGELCNECGQNGVDEMAFSKPSTPTLWSRGCGGGNELPPDPPWDYTTYHGSRGDEWPRDPKTSLEMRDGMEGFGGFHQPVVQDEPMGADEVNQPGRRSNVPEDFRYFAATSTLMGAGSLFHSTTGVYSQQWGHITRACALAFAEGARWPPPDVQLAPYQRGEANGGQGIGNMPLQHYDAWALRTFCKQVGNMEWCVAIRPTSAWQAQPLRGCQVVAQPWRGFVQLQCP